MNGKKMIQANKSMIISDATLNIILLLAYILEFVKGDRSILFTLLIALLTVGPTVTCITLYKKDPENMVIKHLVPISFGILNAIAMFTSSNMLPFTYMIVLLVCMMLYQDAAYSLIVTVIYVICNVVDIVVKFSQGVLTTEDMADVEIRVALVIMITVMVYLVTKVVKQMNDDDNAEVVLGQEKTENMLNGIIKLTDNMSVDIEKVDERMASLAEATDAMLQAMSDVTNGNQETAESIKNQLVRTEDIQKLIDGVKISSADIMNGMDSASNAVKSGHNNMKKLSAQAVQCDNANDRVVTLVTDLQEQTGRMNEIITIITSIANSTGMLALNASIEAARAGEAGRGFAVVANQVSELADQTKDASSNITELISSVLKELEDVVAAVEVLKENTSEEEEEINVLRDNLNTIEALTESITKSTHEMEAIVENLAEANEDIVSKIQKISAVTEEVTAKSQETMDTCKANKNIVQEVTAIAQDLNEGARELKSNSN